VSRCLSFNPRFCLLIRPELQPKTIHHFDSGVSLFWTDFDSS
jgi:hypothetical protein